MILSDRDPFGAKAWREFLNQLDFLSSNNLTPADVAKAIGKEEEKRAKVNAEARGRASKEAKPCPDCGSPMQLLPVNDSPATQTNDDSKSMWLCRNCLFEQYSTKTVNEELELLKESVK